jgi:hypothetical protein
MSILMRRVSTSTLFVGGRVSCPGFKERCMTDSDDHDCFQCFGTGCGLDLQISHLDDGV